MDQQYLIGIFEWYGALIRYDKEGYFYVSVFYELFY